jgi:hypothetical protein
MSEAPSEPANEEIRYFTDLCQCIGFVVVHWSLIERQLDTWINTCVHDCGGRPLLDGKGMPQALKRKISILKRCLRELPPLSSFRNECSELLSRVRSASNRRHDLMHGSIAELRPDPKTGAFRFVRTKYGDEHVLTEFTVTPNDFRDFAPILEDLATDTVAFSQKLEDAFL